MKNVKKHKSLLQRSAMTGVLLCAALTGSAATDAHTLTSDHLPLAFTDLAARSETIVVGSRLAEPKAPTSSASPAP